MKNPAPYRYDIVGSFLRTAAIHEARAKQSKHSMPQAAGAGGFASAEEGNLATDEDQWKKLALVKEIAEEVWN